MTKNMYLQLIFFPFSNDCSLLRSYFGTNIVLDITFISEKAAHKIFQQRGASSIREFSLLHNLQFFARNDGRRLGASSIRDASSIRRITVNEFT